MDILITGAGGRIGSRLAGILLGEGHRVRALGLPGDLALPQLAEEGADVYEGDLVAPDTLIEAVRGVDAVCHLAAALTTHDVDDDAYISSNLSGTYNLLVAVRLHASELARFVYASSDAVYWPGLDNRPLFLPVDESHPLMAGSVYGATKVGAEALCRAFQMSYGVPFVVVRPTATAAPPELIDPSSPFGRRWFLRAAIDRLGTSDPSGAGDASLLELLRTADDGTDKLFTLTDPAGVSSLSMLTHPHDIARGIRAMIERPEAVGEAFNLGPSAPHSERELVAALAAKLSLEMVEMPRAGVRPSWYVSSAKARGLLGYSPEYSVFDMVDLAVEGR